MFGNKMNLNMDNYLPTGSYLNTEEQLTLQTSLPVLQMDNRFSSVAFYAKIKGTNSDYYIAFGRGKDFIRNKMFFYSLEGQFWRLLFPPTEDILLDFRYTRNRFTGDPTHLHRFHRGERKVVLREDLRLAAVVHLLDWETAIGPRGALVIDPITGLIKENPHFKGVEDPGHLSSYLHHRLPKDAESLLDIQQLHAAAGDAGLDFLESIDDDYPSGSWIFREDPVYGVIRLHSLWWPGHSFYYSKTIGLYNSMYIGLGDRNDDLLFMI